MARITVSFLAMVDAAQNEISDLHPFVQMDGVGVSFGQNEVLRNISISLLRGSTLAIIGESGCGKTVLLKTIIGLIRPTSGATYFDGQNLAELSDKALTKQRIRFGFLFQNAALFDSMTVEQNVSFPLREHTRKPDSEVREIVFARLAEVGLPTSIARKKPAELSGGMRKRVGLARALAIEPDILLYDEPTTGLDPIMSDVINELIIGTRKSHPVTSVLVTHDMRTATKVADRIVMLYPVGRLEEGGAQVIFEGTPEEITKVDDRRVAQFVRGEAGERLMEMRKSNGESKWTRN